MFLRHCSFIVWVSLLLYWIPSSTIATQEAGPDHQRHLLLWKIEGKGLERASYMFGTIHVPDTRLYPFPEQLEGAFREAKWVFTEITLDALTQLKAAQHSFLPDNETLQQKMPASDWDRLNRYMKGISPQVTAGLINRHKPWAAAMQVLLLKKMMTLPADTPTLDAYIYQRAAKDSEKQARGLETIEDQLAVFDILTEQQQIDMLLQAVDMLGNKQVDMLEELMQLYLRGDVERFAKELDKYGLADKALQARFNKHLLDDRNLRMLEKMHKHLQFSKKDSSFFAVGAAHYFGPVGLVSLMKRKGYKITRIK